MNDQEMVIQLGRFVVNRWPNMLKHMVVPDEIVDEEKGEKYDEEAKDVLDILEEVGKEVMNLEEGND